MIRAKVAVTFTCFFLHRSLPAANKAFESLGTALGRERGRATGKCAVPSLETNRRMHETGELPDSISERRKLPGAARNDIIPNGRPAGGGSWAGPSQGTAV